MKAAVYYENGGPEVLRYEEVPDPVCPEDGLLVDIAVISLEGGDTLHRARTPFKDRPHIVGYQCAGKVIAVGPRAKGFALHDRVVCVAAHGSHAERIAVSAATCWKIPDGADIAIMACVPVAFASAHEALFHLGGLATGQNVLVHAGASGVGLAAIQLAKAAGAVVTTTASSDEKLLRLKEFGAAHGINYKQASLIEAVQSAVGKNAIDLVIDTVGGKTLQDSVACLRYRGRIVSLGVAGRDSTLFNPTSLWGRNASLVGLSLTASLANENARVCKAVAECLRRVASGELRVVIDRRFALSDAVAAHTYAEGRSAFGRVIMLP